MSITQVKSMVQFSRAGNLVWSAMTSTLPAGVVSFSIDDGVFKLGDGVTPYSQLPVLFTYGELISAQGGVSGLFEEPVIAQNGKIVVVTFDAGSNTTMYSVSDTSLAQLLTELETIETTNSDQDTAIAELLAIALGLDAGINTGGDNNIITIQNRRYSNSGTTVAGAQAQISSAITYVPGSHMEEVELYSDVAKKYKADKLALNDGNTYYADIVGFNNSAESIVYGLTSTNTGVVINNVSGGLFSVRFDSLTGGTHDDVPVVLVASIDSNTGNAKIEKAVACLVQRNRMIAAVYGGISVDYFYGVTIDSSNNIICVGATASEGVGIYDALVVKFASDLSIIARKRYGGTSADYFRAVAVDSSNNIICAGFEGTNNYDALVVKFAPDLSIIARKRYGGTSLDDYFYGVTIDSSNNIICAGQTLSEGTNSDALVVKFAPDLSIIARKRYGGASQDYFYGIVVDSSNNIICVGYTASEGTGGSALVVKFSSDLSIIARKRYGGSSGDYFYAVAADSSNNIICAGYTYSEGAGIPTYSEALVVKFAPDLSIIVRKIYGGSGGDDRFYGVTTDSSNNIIGIGYTGSEGAGGDALVVKFASDLSIIARKRYGGASTDYFQAAVVDSSNNIICVGYTESEGTGAYYDALVIKLPANIPSGTITGTVLTGLTLADSTLTLADSTLTLADSALTLADSALTLADSTLTLADSTLTLEKDILN